MELNNIIILLSYGKFYNFTHQLKCHDYICLLKDKQCFVNFSHHDCNILKCSMAEKKVGNSANIAYVHIFVLSFTVFHTS